MAKASEVAWYELDPVTVTTLPEHSVIVFVSIPSNFPAVTAAGAPS
jgi:hypothetical protein